MIDPQIKRAMDRCFEVALVVRRNFGWLNILPFELITHSAARENRHLQLGASETAVFHGSRLPHAAMRGNARLLNHKLQSRRSWNQLLRESAAEEQLNRAPASLAIVECPVVHIHAHKF